MHDRILYVIPCNGTPWPPTRIGKDAKDVKRTDCQSKSLSPMSKPTDVAVFSARFGVEPLPYRAPLKFGGRIVASGEIMNVALRVSLPSGQEAWGFGSMPLGNVWAWPTDRVATDRTADAIRLLAERIAFGVADIPGYGHPLDVIHDFRPTYDLHAKRVAEELELEEPIPPLAMLLAASPTDAALHDAFGRVNDINSFDGLSAEFVDRDLSSYLGADFRGEFLDQYTLRSPKPTMPLYHLVGALDPLTAADVVKPIADGLPETLEEWIPADGLTHLKIKLNGDDLHWDVERVAAVEAVAVKAQAKRGCSRWRYSCDFNEKCKDVAYVLEFIRKVGELAPTALERIQYIEQPTHRDLKAHPESRMHEAAKLKPIVIDESLVDLESLQLARELGYTGVALKACKGHTHALLAAALAQKFGMFLCVQDLTCPGASFLHSAELAARIPTVAAIEGNARQYCPSGNAGWSEKYPSMFEINAGEVGTGVLTEVGLGHSAP
jgi:L-alanine-DL-glutamate epimerase-like enolase superfamily enzyme